MTLLLNSAASACLAAAVALGFSALSPGMQEAKEASGETAKADASAATLATAKAFLTAAGSGDGETLRGLMASDFVWHNEGDKRVPWIGSWSGPDEVFGKFMPAFASGLKADTWTTDYSFVKDDQAVFMGTMSATLTKSGAKTGVFSWAVRVEVKDGKVKSWNWFEDSYGVSKAFHGE